MTTREELTVRILARKRIIEQLGRRGRTSCIVELLTVLFGLDYMSNCEMLGRHNCFPVVQLVQHAVWLKMNNE